MNLLQVTGPHHGLGSTCEPILRSLPDWFGLEQAIVDYIESIDGLDTFTANLEDELVGFLSIRKHFDRSAEIHVLAVLAEHHRAGVGRALLSASEQHCRELGCDFLQVKTLSPTRRCENYARTRAFYLAMEFHPLEEFPTLWDPANPALQFIKCLRCHP